MACEKDQDYSFLMMGSIIRAFHTASHDFVDPLLWIVSKPLVWIRPAFRSLQQTLAIRDSSLAGPTVFHGYQLVFRDPHVFGLFVCLRNPGEFIQMQTAQEKRRAAYMHASTVP